MKHGAVCLSCSQQLQSVCSVPDRDSRAMGRRKQPAALSCDQVLAIFKVHWRTTEKRLAVQMRERGVQAVVDAHGPMMTALFEVNPTGVYNKTCLREVVQLWCTFHSLPWTMSEIRQEAYAVKVLQKRVLSTARNMVDGTRLSARLRSMSSRLRVDPSPSQQRRRLCRKASAEEAGLPAPRVPAARSGARPCVCMEAVRDGTSRAYCRCGRRGGPGIRAVSGVGQ